MKWFSQGRRTLGTVAGGVLRARAARRGCGCTARVAGRRAGDDVFTASPGLLLMIPNMYKIAGELTAAVRTSPARSLAAAGLSIFGDFTPT